MRNIRQGWGLGALVAASLLVANGALCAADQPVVHVKSVVTNGGVQLEAQATGPFEYTTYRPSSSLYVLDFSGVSAGDAAGARIVSSDLIKSYRVVPFSEGDKPMVRVEVLLAQGLQPQVEKTDAQDLVLTVSRNISAAPVAPASAIVPVAVKSASQNEVGYIRNVTVNQNAGQTEVTVFGSSLGNVQAMRIANPDRLVLDFPSSHLVASLKQVKSPLAPVNQVRMAQYTPQTARVVIDLGQPTSYDIRNEGDRLMVWFPPSAGSVSSRASARPTSLSHAQAEPVSSASKLSAHADVPAPSTTLPAQLTQPNAALAAQDGGQIQVGGVNAALANAQSQAAPPPSGVPAGNPAVVPAAPPSSSPTTFAGGQGAPTPAPSPRYSGDPISVNLKDVDLSDFFRLIHEISGLNVVVDPAVKGTLTIVLDNVPWDQALDIVLHNNDLDKQLDGNVLRIATRATLKAEAQEQTDLAKAQAEAIAVVTTTRVLSYAKATTMATTLKRFLSARGDILADDRSNTLVIRDIPATFPVIDNLLRQLDRKSQQVEIEARIVAANRSFARDIGSQFGLAAANPGGSNIISGTSQTGTSPIIRNFPPLPAPPVVVGGGGSSGSGSGSIPLISNLGATAPTSGLAYAFSSANIAIDEIITAAESKGVGKLLSQPKIITQNNEKGVAKNGTKIPVQTVVNNTVSVQFVDAVLEIDVTPQITADGTIYMDVTVENDQIDNGIPRVQGIPALDTQSVETKVTVNDGATVVLGGMYITNQQTQVNDVPVVGSLPVIGNLFKHTQVSTTSQELFFFLTPRILPS